MNWRFWRHLLIVLGAYFLAMTVEPWLMGAHTLMRIGTSYTDNIFSEAFAAVLGEFPRAIAGALAMVLIWYALGSVLARRWMWGLAGVFLVIALLSARNTHWGREPEYTWVFVRALLPAIGCVLAGVVLQRVAPGGSSEDTIRDEPTPRQGRTVALIVICSAIAMIAGGVISTLLVMSVVSAPCR